MSKVTVREAAFLTGKSRETINTACNDGILSCAVNERRIKVIDVSELERVYPLVRKMDEMGKSEPVKESQTLTETGQGNLREQVAVLRERLESVSNEREILKSERDRERRQLEAEIEHLRTSLEKAQDQHGKAMLMLTHQSEEGGLVQQRQKVTTLEETVLVLKQQNKRIYRELQQQKSQGLWKRLFG